MKKNDGKKSDLDPTAAAFQPNAPAAVPIPAPVPAPAPVAVAQPVPVQPVPVGPAHHIVNGMGHRTGEPPWKVLWTFGAISADLLWRINNYVQLPNGPITITGGVHQNFGDMLGPHYSIRDSSNMSWHVYIYGGQVTAG